jgi:WD40 repeat protein
VSDDAPNPISLPCPFGDYELLEETGRGGMGVIYKARQPGLDRLCAIKMLKAGAGAAHWDAQQLREEAKAAASLDHQNIVGIYEVGEEGGQFFFSMEFVEGQNLGVFVRNQVLSAQQVATYAKKIADAIAYAHSRGVLHCDLKPANILIDHRDEPQITDFGLSRRIGREAGGRVGGSDSTTGAGSPNFMAPEQASARFGNIGPRTDVFGLGATLYYLLTDRPPFRGETFADTVHAVQNLDPVRPRALRPGVPVDLETICLKCLEKRPNKRYQDVQEVADELGRFLRDEPIHARRITRAERAWRWSRRHPLVAGFGAATAILVVLLAVGSSLAAYHINQALAATERQRIRAENSELATRRNLYAADMALAFEALEGGNDARVRDILDRQRPAAGQPDLRGWEWRFLWAQSRSDVLAEFGRHEATIAQVSLLPDGHRVLTADNAGGMALWDLETKGALASATVRGFGPGRFALNRAGTRAAITDRSADGTNSVVRLLDTATLKTLAELPVKGLLLAQRFGPDETSLWLAGMGDAVELELGSGKVRHRYALPTTTELGAFALSPDGRLFATAESGGTIRLRSTDTGEDVSSFKVPPLHPLYNGTVFALDFSPDGQLLASGGNDGAARIWELSRPGEPTLLPGHADIVIAVKFSRDGRSLVTAGRDQFINVWDVPTRQLRTQLRGSRAPQLALEFLPEKDQILTGGGDRILRRWPMGGSRPRVRAQTNFPSGTLGLQLLADQQHVVVISTNGAIRIRALGSDQDLDLPDVPGDAFSSTLQLASGGATGIGAIYQRDGRVRLVTLPDRGVRTIQETNWLALPPGPENSSMEFSADGRLLALGDINNGVRVWRTGDLGPVLRSSLRSRAIALAHDGRRLAASDLQGRMHLFDLPGGHELTLPEATPQLQMIVFSPDGRHLATAGFDGTVRLFDTRAGRLEAALLSRAVGQISLAFSPDGTRLAAGSVDGFFTLWDVATRRELAAYRVQSQPVFSLAIQGDGTLVTLGNNAIRFWPAPTLAETDAGVN